MTNKMRIQITPFANDIMPFPDEYVTNALISTDLPSDEFGEVMCAAFQRAKTHPNWDIVELLEDEFSLKVVFPDGW